MSSDEPEIQRRGGMARVRLIASLDPVFSRYLGTDLVVASRMDTWPMPLSVGTVSVSGDDVVHQAEDYIGTPYRSGGTTPGGMDCSGLVFNVYRSFGIALPRTSRDQSRFGREINRSQLQPGDLVFFNTSGRGVSHVGIYSGRGEFIHASTRARRVRFDRLDNKYFRKRFVVARRVL